MPKRPCISSGCPNFAEYRGRCKDCARQNDKSIRRAGSSLYGSKRWKLTRRRKLFDTPLCENCGSIATEVHHKVDLAEGGEQFAMDNLSSMCRVCHAKITRARQIAA